jgi:hypothetical protein
MKADESTCYCLDDTTFLNCLSFIFTYVLFVLSFVFILQSVFAFLLFNKEQNN